MINVDCCCTTQLCQDIYNCILSHVSCLCVIRNVRVSNTMLYYATKYIKCIDNNIPLTFLVNEKEECIFPELKEVKGNIVVYPELCEDSIIIERLLKLTKIKKLRLKCNYISEVYFSSQKYKKICCSLVNYSSFSHLFEYFQLSCGDDCTSHQIYKLTRKDKLMRVEFIENTTGFDVDTIFIPILGYEYSVVLSFDTEIFLNPSQYNNRINISTLIITKTTKQEPVPRVVQQFPSIKTIFIESEDVESSFFNANHEMFFDITKIITNYCLLYSKNILDSETRIKKFLHEIKDTYRNARIEISVYEDELQSLDPNILYHPNAIIKYIHKQFIE